MLWRGSDICEALELPEADFEAGGISIDSRTLKKGDVFVALKGDNFDGHKFIAQAIEKKASAIIGENLDSSAEKIPHLSVANSLEALQALARHRRGQLKAKIIGITGSVGKTGTKEMLKRVLSEMGECYVSSGNLNNHIGLPLVLANAPPEADYMVLEMGMNNPGEIAFLTDLAKPHLAIVLNVRAAHMMNFANLQEVASAKAEIFASSPEFALALGDDAEISPILLAAAEQAGCSDIRTFGNSSECDYHLLQAQAIDGKNHVSGDFRGQQLTYDIGALGEHVALNSIAVLAVTDMLSGTVADPAYLRDFTAPKGRGALSPISLADGGQAWLIDESYNASPSAISASLKLLATVRDGQADTSKTPRCVAILGDMLELGEQEIAYHVSLAEDLQNGRIDKLITVGERMRHLYEAVPSSMRLQAYGNSGDLIKDIWNHVKNYDIVLVKGSNSIGLGEVVGKLREGNVI